MKKIFSLFMLFLCTFAMLGIAGKLNFKTVDAEGSVVIPQNTTFYLYDGIGWSGSNAQLSLVVFNDGGTQSEWYDFTYDSEIALYKTVVTGSGFVSYEAVRFNPTDAHAHDWENKWNGTSRLYFTEYNNTISIKYNDNWNYGETSRRYIVTFDANGGSFEDSSTSKAVISNGSYAAPTVVKDGYSFLGWATANDAVSPNASSNITKDTTYYACWELVPIETSLKISYRYVVEKEPGDHNVAATGYVFFTVAKNCDWKSVRAHVWNSESSKDVDLIFYETNLSNQDVYFGYIGNGWTNVVFSNGLEGDGNKTPDLVIKETTPGFYQTADEENHTPGTVWNCKEWVSNSYTVTVEIDQVLLQFKYTAATVADVDYKFTVSDGVNTIESTARQNPAGNTILGEIDVTGHLTTNLTIKVYKGAEEQTTRTISAKTIAVFYTDSKFLSNRKVQSHLAAIETVAA